VTSSGRLATAGLVEDLLPGPAVDDDVAEALLTAGREMVEAFGIRRLRMDDVARQAGYGRATLYRRFATRDDLVWAVVTREVQATLLDISRQIAGVPDLGDRVVEAFAVTLERTRANRLLRRLLQIEPDLLLPHLTTRGTEALAISRRLLASLLREGQSRGELDGIDVDVAAELMVRLAHSMLLCPDGPVDIDDPVALRRFARAAFADPLLRWSRPTADPLPAKP
jgi:AcrR family transcriptional regulator